MTRRKFLDIGGSCCIAVSQWHTLEYSNNFHFLNIYKLPSTALVPHVAPYLILTTLKVDMIPSDGSIRELALTKFTAFL